MNFQKIKVVVVLVLLIGFTVGLILFLVNRTNPFKKDITNSESISIQTEQLTVDPIFNNKIIIASRYEDGKTSLITYNVNEKTIKPLAIENDTKFLLSPLGKYSVVWQDVNQFSIYDMREAKYVEEAFISFSTNPRTSFSARNDQPNFFWFTDKYLVVNRADEQESHEFLIYEIAENRVSYKGNILVKDNGVTDLITLWGFDKNNPSKLFFSQMTSNTVRDIDMYSLSLIDLSSKNEISYADLKYEKSYVDEDFFTVVQKKYEGEYFGPDDYARGIYFVGTQDSALISKAEDLLIKNNYRFLSNIRILD